LTTGVSNTELTLHTPRGISEMRSGITGETARTNLGEFDRERSSVVVTAPARLPLAVLPPTGEAKASRYIVSNDERVMKSNSLGIGD